MSNDAVSAMAMAAHLNQSTAPKASAAKSLTAEKLLVAAGELMIERNSVDISLADIAQKSGVNAALVKYHFGNKDGLLLALLERDAANEMTHLDYLLAQPLSPTTSTRRSGAVPRRSTGQATKLSAFSGVPPIA